MRKMTISAFNQEQKTITITVANPKSNITVQEIKDFLQAYDELYSDELILKTAKYIDTETTPIYPAT